MNWDNNFLCKTPYFFPLKKIINFLEKFSQDWPSIQAYNLFMQAQTFFPLYSAYGKILHFIEQEQVSSQFDEQYEPAIYLRGAVATRYKNWHDFFNFCVWTTFPNMKVLLNKLQYEKLLFRKTQNLTQRTLSENIGAQFDESGVIVVSTRQDLLKQLLDFEWVKLFHEEQEAVREHVRFYIFGHGLYEKCLSPYIGLTGKGICFHVKSDFFSDTLDEQLKQLDDLAVDYFSNLSAQSVREALTPVPLLGYPGWCPEQDLDFYLNQNYFRKLR